MWKKINWFLMIEIVLICIILLPILIVSLYALPAADDFSNTNRVEMLLVEKYSYMKVALSEASYYYKNVSGYFFAAFLNFFLSPFLRGGITALRGVVFILNLFFYISLFFLVNELLKFFINSKNIELKVLVYILVLFAFTNNNNNIEIWAWYCVVVGYVFIVGCMFWGIIFFLKALKTDKLYYIIMASVIGFLASGGSLNITALNCGFYLIIGVIGFWGYNKKKTAVICFISALIGGVINALAPGNFIRHELATASYPIVASLKTSISLVISRMQTLLFYSPFILLLMVFLIFFLKNIPDSKCEYKIHPIIILAIIFGGVGIINFPVCLGYNTRNLPYRCLWIEDCAIYIGMFSWTAYLSGWLKYKFKEFKIHKEFILCISCSAVFFLCSLGAVHNIESYPFISMTRQLLNGEIAEYAMFWEDIFDEIERADSKEVIVYRDELKLNDYICSPGISSEKDNWINRAVADYYGKNSVCIIIAGKEAENN